MYILDTNVVSELRKTNSGRAHPAVVRWSNSVAPAEVFLSAVSVFELEMGILKIADRNDDQYQRLRTWFSDIVLSTFSGKILPIDENVALIFARMMTPKTRFYRDALVAATAQHHGYVVVTRNVRDFTELPARVINPWEFA
jgi:predicted nucleic acid-binding protein